MVTVSQWVWPRLMRMAYSSGGGGRRLTRRTIRFHAEGAEVAEG
jgi:hypothetical protein